MTVQMAFENQSAICTKAGAPFTGHLCRLVAQRLTGDTVIGRRILNWQGNPSHEGDALPLRLVGGLHALARDGRRPDWSAIYPPHQIPEDEELWAMLNAVIKDEVAFLEPWLDGPPQTNEVGRSAALMAGLLVLADQYDLPFETYELGASAGLNSLLDLYHHDLAGVVAGDDMSSVRLKPEWTGATPPKGHVEISARHLVDLNPLDPADHGTRTKLEAYVWADQLDRLARLQAALDISADRALCVDAGDAADWLEAHLALEPTTGLCRVVMHTIAYQYFPIQSQERIRRHIEAAGALAREDAPLAWLSFEQSERGGSERRPLLEVTTWPGGQTRTLARCQPHGALIEWLA